MRILFCKISDMKYYKGVCKADEANFGGAFVKENGYGHEEFNFYPIEMEDANETECIGFVEPKSNRGLKNTLHIERIDGCELMINEPSVDDVLVVWCAKHITGSVTVVGWYKHATVWRDLQEWFRIDAYGAEEERCYNIRAKTKDCVLLPYDTRNRHIWKIPSANYTKNYGFGQSMVWYANEETAKNFIEKLVENINNYSGENWLEKYPENTEDE